MAANRDSREPRCGDASNASPQVNSALMPPPLYGDVGRSARSDLRVRRRISGSPWRRRSRRAMGPSVPEKATARMMPGLRDNASPRLTAALAEMDSVLPAATPSSRTGRLSSGADRTDTFLPSMVSFSENEVNGTRQQLCGSSQRFQCALSLPDVGRAAIELVLSSCWKSTGLPFASSFLVASTEPATSSARPSVPSRVRVRAG